MMTMNKKYLYIIGFISLLYICICINIMRFEHHNDDKSNYLYNIIFQNSEDENICKRHN